MSKGSHAKLSNKQQQVLVSKDGYSFDMYSNKWMLNKDITISFQNDVLSINQDTLMGFRLTLARYAEELSASHTANMYSIFQRMVRDTDLISLSVNEILNWKAILGKDFEYKLGALKGFLISWYDYGNVGVNREVVELLDSLKLTGNTKGLSVANRCPYTGAFTENELLAINEELNELFRLGKISFPCYSYIHILQATARRPVQIRELKSSDLRKEAKRGLNNYFLNISRAKQRGSGFRNQFKKLAITEDLYLILKNLINFQIKAIENVFKSTLDDKQKESLPLFLDIEACRKLCSQKIDLSMDLMKTDFLHVSSNTLHDKYIKEFRVKQNAVSERTGDIIQISARRFRHTRGTNLGRKGIGARIIAEALDHSDSQNVKVYAENTADTVQYIDKAVGSQLAPFANAFLGRVIEDLKDGERGDDPTAKIPNDQNEAIGACGTNDFCVNGYESCYVCKKFRPLVDAPHEVILESLYKEKEERLKQSGSVQYASVKDRLIFAVEQVVSKCSEIKAAREEVRNG